ETGSLALQPALVWRGVAGIEIERQKLQVFGSRAAIGFVQRLLVEVETGDGGSAVFQADLTVIARIATQINYRSGTALADEVCDKLLLAGGFDIVIGRGGGVVCPCGRADIRGA